MTNKIKINKILFLGVFLFALFFVAHAAQAATYYVATNGSDSNSGTSAQPWRTIQKSVNSVQGGDTIYVKAGTYNERVVISVSGNANAGYITLRNNPGDTAILSGSGLGNGDMITTTNRSYLKIQGLEIANYTGGGITIYGAADHIQILDNYLHDQSFVSVFGYTILVSSLDWPNSKSASYITISGNRIKDVATGSGAIYNEAIALAFDINHFYITNNILDHHSHIGIDTIGMTQAGADNFLPNTQSVPASPFPRNGIISNNTVMNGGWNGAPGEITGIYLNGGQNIVVEDNVVHDNLGYGIVTSSEDTAFTAQHILVRRNVSYNNTIQMGSGGFAGSQAMTRYVHNAMYTVTSGEMGNRLAIGTDVVFKNNISQNIAGAGNHNYHIDHYIGTNSNPTLDYNLYYPSNSYWQYKGNAYTSFISYKSGSGQDSHSVSSDPLFVAPGSDFHLQSSSPAINTGSFLTTTTGAGSGISLAVNDANYFSDGYGYVPGDLIQVGSNSPVRVTGVNYSSNTITLNQSISWNANDGVSYPYSGLAPDIGAYEYVGGTPIPTLSADLNSDGRVNSVDAAILMGAWGQTAKPKADINQDGIVNSVDASLMMGQWSP